ncbi:MAG: prefoldin subunit [Candidatus Woesearchaeota archaeon]
MEQLAVIQQHIHHITVQKQSIQSELLEIDMALEQVQDPAYVTLGNIMVKKSADTIKKELEEKKEVLHIRIKTLQKQEEELLKKRKELQEDQP